jgi:hypothetical protein
VVEENDREDGGILILHPHDETKRLGACGVRPAKGCGLCDSGLILTWHEHGAQIGPCSCPASKGLIGYTYSDRIPRREKGAA